VEIGSIKLADEEAARDPNVSAEEALKRNLRRRNETEASEPAGADDDSW